MITVDEALSHLFSLVSTLPEELIPLTEAAGRVLAHEVQATRNQPPFAASAMDGYGVRADEVALDAKFKVIGESAAGLGFDGDVRAGEAVRIFTGAPVPDGVDFVLLQEDCDRFGSTITITSDPGDNANIRPAGADFVIGQPIAAPRRLTPADVALLAAMNIAQVPVRRRPDVALISTGNELVMPGDTPGPDQIIASNTFGLKALLDQAGAHARILPIARDNEASLAMAFELAEGADLVITIGGASVGDHDLVGPVAAELGMEQAFYKVAMRPGKPLMAGRMGKAAMIGLPGNPVSAMVCGHLFVLPVVHAMLGLPAGRRATRQARLTTDVAANGPREHYMRARVADGQLTLFDRQDSSLLTILSEANALLLRPVGDGPRATGDQVDYIPL
ncbi:gephyrin-like molybdotransferase Glp [Thalassovita taeanensis]|uniref:Molybdopterin molybdenumtransferase n=1 Tax=Thalassovita taeanensis TaxID=657014 RepID=A0A1H8YVU5_9RHOB|nr:gephyrin-like molybdotransferase Glp [Thalassovita taeanensis]SEP56217.1 molybdopterin molybdotransferase [Thalassovita taeanensis]